MLIIELSIFLKSVYIRNAQSFRKYNCLINQQNFQRLCPISIRLIFIYINNININYLLKKGCFINN